MFARALALLYGLVCYVVFLGVFLYAVGFVGNLGVPQSIDGPPIAPLLPSLAIDLVLLAIFAVQHSVMARPAFKRRWTRVVPAHVERSTFVLAASAALALVFWQWHPLGGLVWDVQAPWARVALHAASAAGWLLVLAATFLIDHVELFGLKQVWGHFRGAPPRSMHFVTPGPYRLVRHPLYLGFVMAFWAAPTMSVTHLVFAVVTTAYILVAIQLEERDLIAVHPEYVAYRRHVPMLVPGRGGRGRASGANAPARAPRGLVGVLLACHALAGPAQAEAQSLDTVVAWNRAMLAALAVPGANPPTVFVTRPLAMVSVAVFDAANAFDGLFHPYATTVVPASGASRDAAVAQAAHDVLVALLPSQRVAFDTLLATSLADLPAQAARDGAAVGAAAANAILELRTGDGWERPVKAYVLPGLPGYWRPTPPATSSAAFTHYPDVVGFIVPDGRQFLTEGPPSLTSERYARDFNETKTLGAVDSAVRTAEQTQMARLWASVGTSTAFWGVWNQVVAQAARTRGRSGLDAARTFALVNMAHHDALLTSFTGKFLYGLWRPVTAIREADTDGNGATDADPAWTPLVPTPPYPGHPGNMACLGAAQARVLERAFGQDAVPFQVTWTATAGSDVTRSYNGFRQLADEGGQSRVWGGIHFTFETLASFGSCTRLGDYAADNVLRAR